MAEYLGRYTHKIAISNYRILDVDKQGGSETFSYLDRKDGYKKKPLTLVADKFISKFLNHILPKGFVRIRHYGFLSCPRKKKMLKIIRIELNAPGPGGKPVLNVRMVMLTTTSRDPCLCQKCKKGIVYEIARTNRAREGPLIFFANLCKKN